MSLNLAGSIRSLEQQVGNHLSFSLNTEEKQENLCRDDQSASGKLLLGLASTVIIGSVTPRDS
jgi:hypothetical protein